MFVKELIAELQKQDPDREVGVGNYHTHYVGKVEGVYLEESGLCVPGPVVVIEMAETNFIPADEA